MSGEHRFRDYLNWSSPRDVVDSTQVHAHLSSIEANSDADLEGSEQQQRLADVLDEYLRNLENGAPVEIEALVARHPSLTQPLREFLEGLDLLQAGIFDLASPELATRSISLEERGRLGDYDIIREVGRGGMGIVYEAQQVSLDRRVALKVLPFASMLDKRQIVRFENEARAAAQLHHANIVPVHGVGCDRGVHYFAMQFIDGQSARELIDGRREQLNVDDQDRSSTSETTPRNSSRLTQSRSSPSPSTSRQQIDQIARLGIQAASALHTAHQCGVVHRDIKPSNLMLDADGDLWITDFGLAHYQSDSNVTRSGDILGTLHYMSPEQARGEGTVADPRSDIYSLGVTLYEMLTLELPFAANTPAEVIKQIELGRCKSVRHWNPRVPHDLENVIAKAMAPTPSDRYRNAKELEEDLQRFVDRKATRAKPPSKTRLLSRWAARNRGVVMSAVAALCVMCATLFVATFWLATQQAALTVQHEKANRKLTTTEQTLENFGLAMAERLKQIPGSEPVRQSLLSDLLEHYQALLAESTDTPSLRANRAVTSTKIASIYRESGDLASAIRAFRAAQSDFRRLRDDVSELVANDSKHAYTSQLATCLSNNSVVLLELGEVDEATAEIDEAIRLQEGLVRARDELGDQIALATSYANRGTIECDRDPRTGVESLMKAAEIAERAQSLVTNAETQIDALRSLAAIYGNLSSRLRGTNLSDAVEYGRRAVDCTRRMVESDAVESDAQRQEFHAMLATNCNNLGTLRVQNQEPDRAIPLYRDAANQLRATNDDASLAVTLGNLAKVQNRMGLLVGAAESYREAIAVQVDLLRESPGNLNHVSRLGGLQNNLAFVWQRKGQLDKACTAYNAAIESQRRAFELAPPHIDAYRDALSRTYFNASRAELAQGRPLRAAEFQRRRGELWPRDSEQLFSVATSLGKIVRQMPSSSDQHNWRKLGLSTLRSALDVDSDKRIDPRQAAELARLLHADRHKASEAKVGSHQL